MELHLKTQFFLKPSRKSIKNQFSNSISIRRNTLNLKNTPFMQSFETFNNLLNTLVATEEKTYDPTGKTKFSILFVQYCDDENEWVKINNESDWAELLSIYHHLKGKNNAKRFALKVRILLSGSSSSNDKDVKGKNVQSEEEEKEEEKDNVDSNESKNSSEGKPKSTSNPFEMFSNMFSATGGCKNTTGNPFMGNPFGFPLGGGSCGFNKEGSNMFNPFTEFNAEKQGELISKFATKENADKAKNWWEENKEKVINIADQFIPKNAQNGEDQSSTTSGMKNPIESLASTFLDSFAQFTESNQTSNPTPSPQPNNEETLEQDLKTYQSQLKELNALGFTNEPLNIKYLKKWGGNLNRVVNSLIEESE